MEAIVGERPPAPATAPRRLPSTRVDQTSLMRWPLAGREAELRFVAEALANDSLAGVVVAGPAGVGKTRLAVEVSQLAASRDCAVEWARATRSAASIPLGAFAPLLPATDLRLPEGVELLARARHALAARAAGRRLVLCVDDGQLLDDASAALVHQLVAAGEAFAVVTVRRDEPGARCAAGVVEGRAVRGPGARRALARRGRRASSPPRWAVRSTAAPSTRCGS